MALPPRHVHLPPRVAVGLLVLTVLALALAPWPWLIKVRALGFGLDPQRPHHSLFLGGEPMPIEARKVGIYGGFALAAGWLALRAPRAGRSSGAGSYLAALAGIAVMGFDGTNAFLYDLGLPHLYAPRLDLRLLTGFAAGLGMAALLWPVWAQSAWRRSNAGLALSHFLGPLLVSAALAVGLLSGQAWLMAPASLIATAGLLAVVTLLNAIVLLVVLRRDATAERGIELLDVIAMGVVLALLELLGLAGLRYALIGTTPLP